MGVFKPFTLGLIKSPFALTGFGVGLITKPTETITEFGVGITQIPSQFKEAPVTTTGELAGQLVGFNLIAKGGNFLKKIASDKALLGSGRSFIIEKPAGIRKTPLSETFPQEFKFEISEPQIKQFVINQFASEGRVFNALSKINQEFILGQVKAKIINNPELFIPNVRKLALRRAGAKNLKQVVRERLEGKFDDPIQFTKAGQKGQQQQISNIQRLSLQRLAENLQKQRITKSVGERLDRPLEKAFDLLSENQKDILISRIKARVNADPSLVLTKTQKIALEKANTQSEMLRVRQAILKGVEPGKVGDILTISQKAFIKSQIESQLRINSKRFLPKQRQVALERFQRLQEKKAIEKAKQIGSKNLKLSDLISKADKDFIKEQFKAQARTQPERFITGARSQALQLVQRQRQVQRQKVFEIKGEQNLSATQKIALRRLRQTQIVKELPKNRVLKQRQQTKQKTEVRNAQLQIQKEKVKLKQSQQQLVQRQKGLNKQIQTLKQKKQTINVFAPQQRFINEQVQQLRQNIQVVQKQQQLLVEQQQSFNSNLSQLQNFIQLERPREFQEIRELQRIRERIKQIQESKLTPLVKGRPRVKKKIRVTSKQDQDFNVFVRKRGRDIKIASFSNKKSARKRLKKTLQTTLRASGFITDKKGKRLKPKITRGFRLSKIDKNRIVERRRFRLDSRSEVIAIKQSKKFRVPKMRRK